MQHVPPSRRAYVIEDDPLLRATVRDALSYAAVEVESFGSAEHFIDGFDDRLPGCMIVDINLPGMSGLELLETIYPRRARFPAIVLSGHGSISSAVVAGRMGVLNFVEKPFLVDELVEAIELAFARLRAVQDEPSSYLDSLSRREVEVLRALSRGSISKGVAYDLGISVRTVEFYRANILKKLKVRTLAQAILLAREGGFV